MVVILWSRVGRAYEVRGPGEMRDAEKWRGCKVLVDLGRGRWAPGNGAEGEVISRKRGGMREAKVHGGVGDRGSIAGDHAAEVAAVVIRKVYFPRSKL